MLGLAAFLVAWYALSERRRLYPATTVVLARFVLRERIGRQRAGGLALGLVGLALIATR